jgi:hypothetical protein
MTVPVPDAAEEEGAAALVEPFDDPPPVFAGLLEPELPPLLEHAVSASVTAATPATSALVFRAFTCE